MKTVHIYWSRRDFRLTDNPALFRSVSESLKKDEYFLPVFILEDYMTKGSEKEIFGYPSRWFLAQALPEFAKNFSNFLVAQGKGAETMHRLVEKIQSEGFQVSVSVNDDILTDFYKQISKLKKRGVAIEVYEDAISINKHLQSGTGNTYSVFTPFKKACWQDFITAKVFPTIENEILHKIHYYNFSDINDIKVVSEISQEKIWNLFNQQRVISVGNHSIDINSLIGEPKAHFNDESYFSEKKALAVLDDFLKNSLREYKSKRDSLEIDVHEHKTSRMSTALAWGLVSARTVTLKVRNYFQLSLENPDWYNLNKDQEGPVHYISELIWREFYRYLFYHYPELMNQEFQEKFRGTIHWEKDDVALNRFTKWIQGRTGYPIVDAAMHELIATGRMHNRARMIVASVLTKNLGVDWRWGQEYFRAMLIDLDEASNNGGWQWGASVGADPKPIRIFNPYLQAKNYDPSACYQRKWLPAEMIWDPIAAIIEHAEARKQALRRYKISSQGVRDY